MKNLSPEKQDLAFDFDIDVIINDERWAQKFSAIDIDQMIRNAVLTALAVAKPEQTGAAEICIVFSNDNEICELNKQWRHKDSATNVLSFPQIEPFAPICGLLGDIILAYETVEKETQNQQIAFLDHVSHLVVHGFVHILGYDHQNDKEALEMESLETKILACLQIEDPYAD